MSQFHQFPAVVELAVVPHDDDTPPCMPGRGTPLADRARAVVARVGRSQLEVRDALHGVLEAVAGLERTVDRLHRIGALRDEGIELARSMVLISAGGIDLQRAGPWIDGQSVHVHLALDVRDARHLLSLRGQIEQRDTGAYLHFRDLRGEERDLIVAFVFQQEAKERRRALDDAAV